MSALVLPVLGSVALACSNEPELDGEFRLFVAPAQSTLATQYFEFYEGAAPVIVEADDPHAALSRWTGPGVAWVAPEASLECEECYRVESLGPSKWALEAPDDLGWQYGTTEFLEAAGVRFFSPFSTYVPGDLEQRLRALSVESGLREPSLSRRGVQLHTLHPIEAYFDFWTPGEAHLERARRVLDWMVKGRVDYVQWVPLDDIESGAGEGYEAWEAHNRSIVDYAHARGLAVGVNVQLFGASNLQHSFDLLDDLDASDPSLVRDAAEQRFELLFDAAPWDQITFSFGEFIGASPEEFIAALDACYDALQAVAPGTPAGSKIHLGNYEDLQYEYMGQTLNFYFLAEYANPAIVPWVHTVMYYTLYASAGGAYGYDEFADHRAMLHRRLEAGQPVAYYPETAYWVAFDVSVPTYLPVYIRSRVVDILETQRLAANSQYAGLDEHYTFSSGWEWGYWQNDYVTFRAGFDDTRGWEAWIEEMFEPFGEAGGTLSELIIQGAEEQSYDLIDQGLGPYMAGRDGAIDIASLGGIASQPDRPSLDDVAAYDPAERAEFRAEVLNRLHSLSLREYSRALQAFDIALTVDELRPWAIEVAQGFNVNALRLSFVANLYGAVLDDAEGLDVQERLTLARSDLQGANEVITDRHTSLHYPEPGTLLYSGATSTRYAFGYLRMANELCYWQRELIQAEGLLEGSSQNAPSCF